MNREGFVAEIVLFIVIGVALVGAIAWIQYYYLPHTMISSDAIMPVTAATTAGSLSTPAAASSSHDTPNPTREIELINAVNGGTITLADGSSVEIPAGVLGQDETITVSLNGDIVQPTSGLFVGIGNNISLSLSNPLSLLPDNSPKIAVAVQSQPATSTMLRFIINVGNNTTELARSIPAVDVIMTDNENFILSSFLSGSYSSSTNQAIIYVNPIVLQLPDTSSSTQTKTLVVGMIGSNCQMAQCVGD
jgi:hypothetical protein